MLGPSCVAMVARLIEWFTAEQVSGHSDFSCALTAPTWVVSAFWLGSKVTAASTLQSSVAAAA